jgi:RimJ/RimL family protein N-acetyltransferase
MSGTEPPAVFCLASPALENDFVRLEPYTKTNRDALADALDVDPEAWAVFSSAGFGEYFAAWWDAALKASAAGERLNFVVRLKDGPVVGSTSFLGVSEAHRHVEIGATFLHPRVRGGAVNPAIKRLMLSHAFEAGAHRVQIVTDARNARSQAAIAKLGAVREGVLRRDKVTWTGHVRDTVVYSIIAAEWPGVRDRLDARLATFRGASSD